MKFLAAVLCLGLPLLVLARFEECDNAPGADVQFPEAGMTGYRSYRYTTDNIIGVCNGATETCRAEFPDNRILRDRSWFLTNNRDANGLYYPRSFLQLFNVQCPVDTYLHLFPQRLQTERGPPGNDDCLATGDYVQIEALEDVFCGNQGNVTETNVYNGGLGSIVAGGNVTVEFCTNPNTVTGLQPGRQRSLIADPQFDGFVVRATCVDPRHAFFEGCASYSFFQAWDPMLFTMQEDPYPKPERLNIPHKRSVEKSIKSLHKAKSLNKKMEKRFKRFVSQQSYTFEAGQTVAYTDGVITFRFNNGTPDFTLPSLYYCVYTISDFFGPKFFYQSAPFEFTGPGKVEVEKNLVKVMYFVDTTDNDLVQSLLIPGADIMMMVNRIYEYIFDCWIFPYPVLDSTMGILPLPRSETVDIDLVRQREGLEGFGQLEATRFLNYLKEDFWPIATNARSCYRGTLIRAAPRFGSTIPPVLYSFCELFQYSCQPLLRIACQQLVKLRI